MKNLIIAVPGETDADGDLSERGRKQVKKIASQLVHVAQGIVAMTASANARAYQSAQIIRLAFGIHWPIELQDIVDQQTIDTLLKKHDALDSLVIVTDTIPNQPEYAHLSTHYFNAQTEEQP